MEILQLVMPTDSHMQAALFVDCLRWIAREGSNQGEVKAPLEAACSVALQKLTNSKLDPMIVLHALDHAIDVMSQPEFEIENELFG